MFRPSPPRPRGREDSTLCLTRSRIAPTIVRTRDLAGPRRTGVERLAGRSARGLSGAPGADRGKLRLARFRRCCFLEPAMRYTRLRVLRIHPAVPKRSKFQTLSLI